MPRDPSLRLEDIIDACNRITGYLAGFDAKAFERDPRTVDAVIRQLEIIGEAIKALPDDVRRRDPSIPWKKIAGFRDVLAHGYFAVDILTVWDAAARHLPGLRDACQKLLAEPPQT